MNNSLDNMNNYKNIKTFNINIIIKKYSELVIEYLKNIKNIKIKSNNLNKFIIIRGLDTIMHVFNILLYYTKNIDITFLYCQKSIFYYIEFINQIFEEEKMFLNLSSRDATIYVYKKTIFDINKKCIENIEISDELKEQFDIILIYIEMYKTIILKIQDIKDSKDSKYNKDQIINNQINIFDEISNKLSIIKIKKENVFLLKKLIDELYFNSNTEHFLEIIQILLLKIEKKSNIFEQIKNKLLLEDFFLYVNKNPDNFIDYLTKSS